MAPDSLRFFLAPADTGSFSRIADWRYVSQSAVSQCIRALGLDCGQVPVDAIEYGLLQENRK